jgi:hypothetical protein
LPTASERFYNDIPDEVLHHQRLLLLSNLSCLLEKKWENSRGTLTPASGDPTILEAGGKSHSGLTAGPPVTNRGIPD